MTAPFGLGFIFSGRDRGLAKMFGKVEGMIDRAESSLERLNHSASRNALGSLVDGIQLHKLNQIGDGIDRIASSASNARLTNSLDSIAVTVGKDFSKAFASLEGGGKAFDGLRRSVTRSVVSMNLDQGKAIETAKEFASYFGADFAAKFGFKSTGSFLKTIETLEIQPAEAASALAKLTERSKLTAIEAQTLSDEVLTLGQKFGVGTTLLNGFYGKVGDIQDGLREMGISAPKDTSAAIRSISFLSGALVGTGEKADAALDKSMSAFKKITENQSYWLKAYAGMAKDSPEFLNQLTVAFGSLDQALEVAKADPATMIAQLGAAMTDLKAKGKGGNVQLQRLVALQSELGIPLEETAAVMAKFVKENGDLSKALDGSAGAMKRTADAAHRTGRTVDEMLDLMKQGFESKMRRIVSKELFGPQGFVTRQKEGYKLVGDTMKNMAADDGPVGFLTKKLIVLQQVGLSGLFSGPMGVATDGLFDLAAALLPAATAAGALGFRFGGLFAPVRALAAPLTIVSSLLGGIPGKLIGLAKIPLILGAGVVGIGALASGGIGESITGYVKNKLPVDLLRAMTGFNDKKFTKKYGMTVKDMLTSGGAWTVVQDGLTDALGRAWAFAVDNFGKGTAALESFAHSALDLIDRGLEYASKLDYSGATLRLIEGIGSSFNSKSNVDGLGSKFVMVLKKAFTVAADAAGQIGGVIWEKTTSWWMSKGDSTWTRMKTVWQENGEMIGKAFIAAMFLSSSIRGLVIAAVAGIAKLAVRGVGVGLAGAATGGAGASGGLLGGLTGLIGASGAGMGRPGRLGSTRDGGTGRFRRRTAAEQWGHNYRQGAGKRAMGGAALGGVYAVADLGMKYASGEEIKGRDYGGAGGAVIGAALGAALGGPVGAMIGGVLGQSAGTIFGKMFEQSPKINAAVELALGGLGRTAISLESMTSSSNTMIAGMRAESDAARARAAGLDAMTSSMKTLAESEMTMFMNQTLAMEELTASFKKLAATGSLTADHVDLLRPVMDELFVNGKLTADQYRLFNTEGKLAMTSKELNALAVQVQADTAFLADERRRKAQELELRVSEVREKEMQRQLDVERKSLEIRRDQQALGDVDAKKAMWDQFSGQFAATSANPKMVSASAAATDAAARTVSIKELYANQPKAIRDTAVGIAERAQAAKRIEAGNVFVGLMKDAGVKIPEEVKTLLAQGMDPASTAFRTAMEDARLSFDETLTKKESLDFQLAQLDLERSTIAYESQKELSDATTELAQSVKKAALQTSFDQLNLKLQEMGVDTKALESQFMMKMSAFDPIGANSILTTMRQRAVPSLKPNASGGRIDVPTILSDMSGRPYGTMAERGPEDIVPLNGTRGDRDVLAVLQAIHSELRRTREVKVVAPRNGDSFTAGIGR